jgi:serine phosphatase RsbU (regulator of sigma subunit)
VLGQLVQGGEARRVSMPPADGSRPAHVVHQRDDRPVGQRGGHQLGQPPDGDVRVELGGEPGADLAEGLQRSLLSEPPVADGLQIAVRYVPAAEAARVGGDWYDAFLAPDGGTLLVIGDVVGHDTQAAAAMGQVRGLLRGIAFTTGDSPAAVLTRLDHAVTGLHPDTTVTSVVARVEAGPGRPDGAIRILWSNAGHPPPMVVTADGSVTVLSAARADLLLGWDPDTTRAESEATLARGATLLMYTDGLVERRGEDLDQGLDRLRTALGRIAAHPLDQLCDELLATMRPLVPDDDVALIAVRSDDREH